MLGAIVSGAYMYIMDAELSQRSGTIYTIDVVMGVILILLILEACRRLMGWALPIVALVMIGITVWVFRIQSPVSAIRRMAFC